MCDLFFSDDCGHPLKLVISSGKLLVALEMLKFTLALLTITMLTRYRGMRHVSTLPERLNRTQKEPMNEHERF